MSTGKQIGLPCLAKVSRASTSTLYPPRRSMSLNLCRLHVSVQRAFNFISKSTKRLKYHLYYLPVYIQVVELQSTAAVDAD